MLNNKYSQTNICLMLNVYVISMLNTCPFDVFFDFKHYILNDIWAKWILYTFLRISRPFCLCSSSVGECVNVNKMAIPVIRLSKSPGKSHHESITRKNQEVAEGQKISSDMVPLCKRLCGSLHKVLRHPN